MHRILHPQPSRSALLRACLALLLAPCFLPATEPSRKEVWVPSKHFAEVQKQHPGAVMLSPEEYESLIHDAFKTKPMIPTAPSAPTSAVVTGMTFRGKVDPTSDLIMLTGEVIVQSLIDDWAELDVRLPVEHLSSVAAMSAQDRIALSAPDKENIRKLIVRGKGEHKLLIEGIGYLANLGSSGRQGLTISTSTWPGALQLELPSGSEVVSKGLTTHRIGNTLHMPLRQDTKNGKVQLIWTLGTGIDRRLVAENNRNRASVHLAAQTITAQWSVWLEQLGSAPGERTITLDLNAPDIAVANVRGAQLARWQQRGSQLDLTVNADHGTNADFFITLTAPLNLTDTAQPISIPALGNPSTKPSATSAPPRETSPQLTRAFNADIASIDPDIALIEITRGQITERGLRWRANEEAPQLVVRRAKPRVLVDADALVKVTRDDIVIEHTLGIGTDRAVNELRVTLPDDEIFDTTSSIAGPPMEWKRVGQTLEYRWPQGLPAGAGCTVKLNTRQRFVAGAPIKIAPLAIPEAVKVSGYVALDYDTTWRVNITDTTGLEERDVTLTPVKGRMAWFNLRSFQLAFNVQRREPVFDVDAIAYALPRAHSVEIEGQFTLGISEAPLREVKVRFSKDNAAQVRFTSANVAEQKLDATTGEWTVSLRQETLGMMNLRWALSIAAETRGQKSEVKGQQPDDSPPETRNLEPETLTTILPQLSIPQARRFTGQWIIEANTDTEITFDAKAMQTNDVRRVPIIEGYTPRHRLVASYAFATAEASLTLHAARHGHSELAALVVNEMALRTVLATDGSTRHEATLIVQHSGEQFLNVQLPAQAILLSTLAAEHPVKPVRGPNGALSIPLPPGSANQPNLRVRLTYETTGATWTSSGQRHLDPPTIPGNVPVLATRWEVFAPEGYDFGKVDTTMEQSGVGMTKASWSEAAKRFLVQMSEPVSAVLTHRQQFKRRSTPSITDASSMTDEEMVEIRPEFPKPMFVGTPVPMPQQMRDPSSIAEREISRRKTPNEEAKDEKRTQVLGDTDVLKNRQVATSSAAAITLPDEPDAKEADAAGAFTRDQTRARMLNNLTEGWEDAKPTDKNGDSIIGRLAFWTDDDATKANTLGKEGFKADAFTTFKVGLLSLALDLPTTGHRLSFHGLQAPQSLDLSYTSWERQLVWGLVCMAIGAALFLAWGRRWPCLATLLAVIVLVGGVGLVNDAWQPQANALLLGWLAALALHGVRSLITKLDTLSMKRRTV